MAAVTNLKSIANNTQYPISVRNGENVKQSFSIGAGGVWNGDLWVPWIGNSSENYKAIRLILGPKADVTIWLFQDYWEPPHQDAVKYFTGPQMEYGKDAIEVPGNNRGGGDKILRIFADGSDYSLKME